MDVLCCPSSEFCEDKGIRCLDGFTTFSFYFKMSHQEVILHSKHYPATVIDTSVLHITS